MESVKPEIRRQAYLQALGIQTYTARMPLVGALASPVLDDQALWGEGFAVADVPASPQAPQSVDVSAAVSLAVEPPIADAMNPAPELERQVASESDHLDVGAETPSESNPEVDAQENIQFTLHVSVIQGKGVIITELDDLLAPGLSLEEHHLFQNIIQALGWQQAEIDNSLFKWPFSQNKKIKQGPSEAQQAVVAYLSNLHLPPHAPKILLGASVAEIVLAKFKRFDEMVQQQDTIDGCVVSYSLSKLLQSPVLKKQLWQQLAKVISS